MKRKHLPVAPGKLSLVLGGATAFWLYAGSAQAAMPTSPCTGSADLRTAANLGTPNFVMQSPTTLTTSTTQCARYENDTAGQILDVAQGGELGNAILKNNAQLVIGSGGRLWGYAEAGGSMSAFNPSGGGDPAPSTWGGVGSITVQQGGILATALIGPGSQLIVGAPASPGGTTPAIVGRIETTGTVTVQNSVVDLSYDAENGLRGGVGYSAISVKAGTTNIIDSTVRSRLDAHQWGIFLGGTTADPDIPPPDGTPITLNMTGSTLENTAGGIFGMTQNEGNRNIVVNLTNSTISSDPTQSLAALQLGQRALSNTSTSSAIVTGSTLNGATGLFISGQQQNGALIYTQATTINGLAAAQNPDGTAAGVYIAGTAQAIFDAGTVINGGAVDGIRIGSDSSTQLAAAPQILVTGNSRVTSQGGAALHVTRNGSDALATSVVQINNGSSLEGLGGQSILVDSGASSSVMVDGATVTGTATVTGAGSQLVLAQSGSTMTGGLTAASGGTLTAGLSNSTLTGDMAASGGSILAARLEQSTVTGNASVDGAGSNLELALVDDGVMAGNVAATNQGIASITASGSGAVLNGSISADNATANVALTNGGQVTGGIQLTNGATGRIAVDGSGSGLSSGGTALSVAGGSNAELQVTNGAQLSSASGMLVDVTGNSLADVSITNANATGSMQHDANSTLNVTLNGSTTLTGATNANTLNINNGALWKVGDATQSNVGTLNMANGLVNMNSGAGPFKTLKVGTLQGNGTFTMGVDFIPGGSNDLLMVTGNASGTHVLDPYGEDQGVKAPRNNIVVSQIGGGNASFALSGSGRVDAGIYTYTLEHQGNEWVLVRDDNDNNGGSGGGPGGGPGPDTPPSPPQPDSLSPAAVTSLNTASALPFVWNNELGTLRQRQGDLRDNKAGDGIWVRPFSSFSRIDQMAAPAYKLNQYGMLIGADKRLLVSSGDLYVGGFGSYSYSEVDPTGSSTGRINSYGLGAYATWMGPDGWYVDTVLKANSFQSDLRVVGSNGRTSKGNYTTPGIGASVEVGKTIPLSDKGFMEPYTEFSVFGTRGSSTKLDNNFDIDNGSQRSVQAEAGVLAGHRFDLHNGRFIQPYIKMGLAHEFIDNNRSTLNGTGFTNDISGTRVIGGVGVSAQLKQNLQMHVDVDYSTGSPVDRNLAVDVGLRYVF